MNPDSPSALVRGAKIANYDYNQIAEPRKVGEPVMQSLVCKKLELVKKQRVVLSDELSFLLLALLFS